MKKDQPWARLRLVAVDGELVNKRYKSGRNSRRATPEMRSTSSRRSTGTPALRHLWIACGEMPSALAKAPMPPDFSMTASTIDSMPPSQPQVEFLVNLPLVVNLNRGFHSYGMSPLGKIIKNRLKQMGKTQAWLAEEVGVTEQAVSKWFRTGQITLENAETVSEKLKISMAQLRDKHPAPEEDELWHSFPVSLKQRVLALIDEISKKRTGS